MNRSTMFAAAVATAALTGCVSYPVYQPVPVARLSPEQSAALASRPVDQAERDRYAAANAQVQREDQADIEAQRQAGSVAYTYGVPVYPPYSYGYYGYPAPYYGGYYPWFPGVSLSLGYGWRGGYGYRGGYHGGYRGGFRGGRGGRR